MLSFPTLLLFSLASLKIMDAFFFGLDYYERNYLYEYGENHGFYTMILHSWWPYKFDHQITPMKIFKSSKFG